MNVSFSEIQKKKKKKNFFRLETMKRYLTEESAINPRLEAGVENVSAFWLAIVERARQYENELLQEAADALYPDIMGIVQAYLSDPLPAVIEVEEKRNPVFRWYALSSLEESSRPRITTFHLVHRLDCCSISFSSMMPYITVERKLGQRGAYEITCGVNFRQLVGLGVARDVCRFICANEPEFRQFELVELFIEFFRSLSKYTERKRAKTAAHLLAGMSPQATPIQFETTRLSMDIRNEYVPSTYVRFGPWEADKNVIAPQARRSVLDKDAYSLSPVTGTDPFLTTHWRDRVPSHAYVRDWVWHDFDEPDNTD